jgi:hypothetical protein
MATKQGIRKVGFADDVKSYSVDQFKKKFEKTLTPEELDHYVNELGLTGTTVTAAAVDAPKAKKVGKEADKSDLTAE